MPHKNIYLSGSTDALINQQIEDEIKYFSNEYSVDVDLIRAICYQESKMYLFAIRLEPHLMKARWYYRHLTEDERRDKFYFCSYGPMQIMFANARAHGFKGSPFELFTPKNSIAYGILHIKKLLDKYDNIPDAVSAYNQGTPRKYICGPKKGMYRNQHYVDKVLNYRKKLKEG